MTVNYRLSAFLSLAATLTFFYTYFKEAIFDWHADPNSQTIKKINGKLEKTWLDKRKELKDKESFIKDAPAAWVIEGYIHVFLGLALGWFFFWILLNRLKFFDGKLDLSSLGLPDLILLIAGWIGINGRLPTIAHAVQEWFKRS